MTSLLLLEMCNLVRTSTTTTTRARASCNQLIPFLVVSLVVVVVVVVVGFSGGTPYVAHRLRLLLKRLITSR